MDLGIRDRAALVGGGSSGIGLAAARALAAEGVRVALVARRPEETRQAAAEIGREFGVETLAVVADLAQPGACENAVASATSRFGTLDVVVANAGGPPKGRFEELSDDAWRGAFELSYLTTVRLARASLPGFRARRWGRLVIVGSIVTREPRPELALSSGLRTGLVALTRVLARETAADGITVNMVSPGYTRTRRQLELSGVDPATPGATSPALEAVAREIPAGRMAEAAEIGAVIAFLASQPAAFLTGVNLLVDGGHSRGI